MERRGGGKEWLAMMGAGLISAFGASKAVERFSDEPKKTAQGLVLEDAPKKPEPLRGLTDEARNNLGEMFDGSGRFSGTVGTKSEGPQAHDAGINEFSEAISSSDDQRQIEANQSILRDAIESMKLMPGYTVQVTDTFKMRGNNRDVRYPYPDFFVFKENSETPLANIRADWNSKEDYTVLMTLPFSVQRGLDLPLTLRLDPHEVAEALQHILPILEKNKELAALEVDSISVDTTMTGEEYEEQKEVQQRSAEYGITTTLEEAIEEYKRKKQQDAERAAYTVVCDKWKQVTLEEIRTMYPDLLK